VEGTTVSRLAEESLATAKAHSKVSDVSLAGGAVKIDSVTSDAFASTDGVTAKASGKTVVSGMTVGGVPVTVDGDGVHAQGQSPVPLQTGQQTVNTVLTNLGMSIYMGSPITSGSGPGKDYFAGSLVIYWAPPPAPSGVPLPGGNDFTVTLGGAAVSVDGDPALDFGSPTTPTDTPTDTPVIDNPPVAVAPPVVSGITGLPETPVDTSVPPTVTPPATVPTAPVLASRAVTLPDGLSPAYAVLGLVGAGFCMLGMRRLPDRVLAATASACPLEVAR
jgi:hypothetical protein